MFFNSPKFLCRKIAAAQRTVFGRSVEPNLKSALVERNHKLDFYFSVNSQAMSLKKDKETGLPITEIRTGVS